MTRFDQEMLLDRLAAQGQLERHLMGPLASAIAALHRDADPRPDQGGHVGMVRVVDGNAVGLTEQGAGSVDPELSARVTRAAGEAVSRHAALLEARRLAGRVRPCHGDLHLRNIVLLDGRPTLRRHRIQ
jgi:aminoglycoside phosphotransferase family enzyme